MSKLFYPIVLMLIGGISAGAQQLKIRIQDGHFVDSSNDCFIPFGYNYGGTGYPLLLEDNWQTDTGWALIASDFQEMKALSANTVRIHLQYNRFMDDPFTPNEQAFDRLLELAELAEAAELYLLITGLGAYRFADQPVWYDTLSEQSRWATQALFWSKVAETLHDSPAVFSYDLMNEPVFMDTATWTPGNDDWGFHFVQNLTRTPNGRNFQQVVLAWSEQMIAAIRHYDPLTPITIGFIGCGAIREWSAYLDYMSVHAYPQSDADTTSFCSARLTDAISMVTNNQGDKPFVVSEIAMLFSVEATQAFMDEVCPLVNGWFNHYGGTPIDELSSPDSNLLNWAILNLSDFKSRYPEFHQCQTACGGAVSCLEGSEPDPNLIGSYNFNGLLTDDSGSGHHLVNHQGIYAAVEEGGPVAAIDFDPANMAYLTASDVFPFQHDRSFTLFARVYPRWAVNSTIWAYDDKDSHDGDSPAIRDMVRLEINNTGLFDGQVGADSVFYFTFSYGRDNSTFFSPLERLSSACFAFDNWYLIAAVYDVGVDSSYLYVNGHLQEAIPHGIPVAWAAQGQYPLVGRNDAFGPLFPGYFNGKIDYIKVFDRALLPSEIAACAAPANVADCSLVSVDAPPSRLLLSVYPNPADDRLFIQLNQDASLIQLTLFDAQGRSMITATQWAADGLLQLNTSALPGGLYWLHLIDAHGRWAAHPVRLHK